MDDTGTSSAPAVEKDKHCLIIYKKINNGPFTSSSKLCMPAITFARNMPAIY
jgi:hypothetical protein